MAGRLGEAAPDLGESLAGDCTGLKARRSGAEVGAVMVVHATFATLLAMAPRREGTSGKMRLSPIARALREKVFDQSAGIKHSETNSTAGKEPSEKPAAAVT